MKKNRIREIVFTRFRNGSRSFYVYDSKLPKELLVLKELRLIRTTKLSSPYVHIRVEPHDLTIEKFLKSFYSLPRNIYSTKDL